MIPLPYLLKGIVLGFSIAAPVGPIGVLCIRRTLAEGRAMGLVVGLGAAVADSLYGAVAAFGLTAVSEFLKGQNRWLGGVGGAFLCYLGVRTFLSSPARQEAAAKGKGLLRAFASTAFLTLTNPMTILSFLMVFASLGLGSTADPLSAMTVVVGVFLGSALWWLLLSSGVATFRHRVNDDWMRWINRFSGVLIGAFGIHSLVTALRP